MLNNGPSITRHGMLTIILFIPFTFKCRVEQVRIDQKNTTCKRTVEKRGNHPHAVQDWRYIRVCVAVVFPLTLHVSGLDIWGNR